MDIGKISTTPIKLLAKMAMKFTLLCLISMLFSCTKTTIETFTVVPKESLNYNIYIDSIRIETPGTTREFPYPFPSLNYSSDQFAGLDLRMGHINIFDKYTLDLKDSIVIYQEGPNIIQKNMIGGIYYHSPDTVFVLQHVPNRLLIINRNAEIIWQKDFNELFNKSNILSGLLAFSWFERFGIYFYKNKLYFGLRQNQAHQDYRNPIIGFYDFDKNQIFTLDIQYPEFYKSNDDIGIYGFPSITYYNENIFITYPYSPETYIYDFNGILLGQIESHSKFKTGQPPEPGEDKRMHGKNNPFYSGIIPLDQGKYFIQSGRHRIPEDPENESFGFTIIYNQEFTNFITFDKNDLPLSFDGDYFYYPIPPEQSEYQLMERYRIEME